MTGTFAGDTKIDGLLKMTNNVLSKLKKEIQQINYFFAALTRDTTSLSLN